MLRREGCDSLPQLPKVPTARPLRPLPSPQTFLREPPSNERAALEVVSCLSLGVYKQKHNRGKGSLPQSKGRLRLEILLPELPPHKPILQLVVILLCARGYMPPSLGLGVPVCDGRGVMCFTGYLSAQNDSWLHDSKTPISAGDATGSWGSQVKEPQATSAPKAKRIPQAALPQRPHQAFASSGSYSGLGSTPASSGSPRP